MAPGPGSGQEAPLDFTITAQNGDAVKMAAPNWFLAVGKALPFFKVDLDTAGAIHCEPEGPGKWTLSAPAIGRRFIVRVVKPRKITVVAVGSSGATAVPPTEPEPLDEDLLSPPPLPGPPPSLVMPSASIQKVLPPEPVPPPSAEPPEEEDDDDEESLAERLFDLSADLSGAEPDRACQIALDLVLDFVDAEAGSVARGSINDPALTFVAATGPVRHEILGRQIPFGQGLVGLAFDVGGTLLVNDADSDSRHLHEVDRETGFHTMAALTVPIRTDEGRSYGVIQVLNQSGRGFGASDVEVVETVAYTLATALAAVLG